MHALMEPEPGEGQSFHIFRKITPLSTLCLQYTGGVLNSCSSAKEILSFLDHEPFDRLLLFYPDLPLFHPPSVGRLVFLKWLMAQVSHYCRKNEGQLFIDIVDLPLYQSKDLSYSLRLSSGLLKKAESLIFSCAQKLIVPSKWFVKSLKEDYNIDSSTISILHNGLYSSTIAAAKSVSSLNVVDGGHKREEQCRFFYSGSLDRKYSRNISRFIDLYLENYRPENRLFLAGPQGQWLFDQQYVAKGITYLGNVGEIDCLQIASQMDFGLIPYSEAPYFRNCFPSKLGFYHGAGIPVLSTALDETMSFITRYHWGEFSGFAVFGKYFAGSMELKEKYKTFCPEKNQERFSWDEMAISALD